MYIFGVLGGDYAIHEVNAFDYVTLVMSIGAFASVFFVIPKQRTILRVILCILRAEAALRPEKIKQKVSGMIIGE